MSFDKIIYRLTDKRIPAVTGIGLVGDILARTDFQNWFTNVESAGKRSKKQIDTGAVLTTFIALLCMGKPDFESVAELQNDAAFYQTALHLKRGFPSAATLRQRMDAIGKSQRDTLLQFNTHLLKSNGIEPTPLKNGMVPVPNTNRITMRIHPCAIDLNKIKKKSSSIVFLSWFCPVCYGMITPVKATNNRFQI